MSDQMLTLPGYNTAKPMNRSGGGEVWPVGDYVYRIKNARVLSTKVDEATKEVTGTTLLFELNCMSAPDPAYVGRDHSTTIFIMTPAHASYHKEFGGTKVGEMGIGELKMLQECSGARNEGDNLALSSFAGLTVAATLSLTKEKDRNNFKWAKAA